MLKEKFRNKKIILASNSPRRKQFLTDLGVTFSIQPANVNEEYPSFLKGKDIALYIAEQKASVFSNIADDEIIITCDTVVWIDDTSLEKPQNKEDALQMLQKLSGKTHEVISAVCIKSKEKEMLFSDTTFVTFNQLSTEDILFYIETYQPYDKAGAYGIQEWIGLVGIEKINGSYTNVVGMPMEKLYKNLNAF
ncbi:MAG: septum formation protein Maf [Myroides sp.]|nr:Maf family nucleotide pyrophosphatase [uncultured Flavobacterium sp.]MBS7321414.1 septum formation protein Maf [Myroides sp.]